MLACLCCKKGGIGFKVRPGVPGGRASLPPGPPGDHISPGPESRSPRWGCPQERPGPSGTPARCLPTRLPPWGRGLTLSVRAQGRASVGHAENSGTRDSGGGLACPEPLTAQRRGRREDTLQPPNQPTVWSQLRLGPVREGLCVALGARAPADSTCTWPQLTVPARPKFPAVLRGRFLGPSPLLRAAAEGAPWGAVPPSCQPQTPRSQQVGRARSREPHPEAQPAVGELLLTRHIALAVAVPVGPRPALPWAGGQVPGGPAGGLAQHPGALRARWHAPQALGHPMSPHREAGGGGEHKGPALAFHLPSSEGSATLPEPRGPRRSAGDLGAPARG